MKYYKVKIIFEDAIRAKDIFEAKDKIAWDVIPRMNDVTDYTEISEVDKLEYEHHTRDVV